MSEYHLPHLRGVCDTVHFSVLKGVSLTCTHKSFFKIPTSAQSLIPSSSHLSGLKWGMGIGVFESSLGFLRNNQGGATLGLADTGAWGELQE